ncbi:DUF2059 domain-containing protein [Stakelama tenebrarum]|uniref:DUF2059 domain-containing protein n=1 Tax=Stakelama tenebrarum TaxID=2711215 RepID=A0A6G6Y233_9SPHN|nr:DUF2059 domain-containing protein [Sphingosinithalassobacter tenebrarum]QIG78778.1 DUF2059 domain-containing protein [Sphingosinithalassobacter tenebrarum]
MKRLMAILCAALVVALPLGGAGAAGIPVQQHDAHWQAAYKLAQTVRTEAHVHAEIARLYDSDPGKALLQEPAIAELERQYPGIADVMMNSIRSYSTRDALERLPDLWERFADIYADGLTDAELAVVQAFYESPAGQRFLDATIAGLDPRPMMAEMIQRSERAAEASDISRMTTRAGVSAVGQLSSEDQAALMAFAKTGAFRKMSLLAPRIQQASADWANDQSPELMAEAQAAMVNAATAYMAQADLAPGKP